MKENKRINTIIKIFLAHSNESKYSINLLLLIETVGGEESSYSGVWYLEQNWRICQPPGGWHPQPSFNCVSLRRTGPTWNLVPSIPARSFLINQIKIPTSEPTDMISKTFCIFKQTVQKTLSVLGPICLPAHSSLFCLGGVGVGGLNFEFPGSHVRRLPASSQWEALIGNYKVGEREKSEYLSCLPTWDSVSYHSFSPSRRQLHSQVCRDKGSLDNPRPWALITEPRPWSSSLGRVGASCCC